MNGVNIIPRPSPGIYGCTIRKTGKHTNLTDHAGEDRNAVFTPDGQTVYFLSERNGGSFNVYSFPLNTPQSITAVTKFKTHPVRFLSTSSDNTLCYTYDGEIYTQRPGVNPQKVRIDLSVTIKSKSAI